MGGIRKLIPILIGLELIIAGQLEINDQLQDYYEDQVIEEVFLNTFGLKVEAMR